MDGGKWRKNGINNLDGKKKSKNEEGKNKNKNRGGFEN